MHFIHIIRFFSTTNNLPEGNTQGKRVVTFSRFKSNLLARLHSHEKRLSALIASLEAFKLPKPEPRKYVRKASRKPKVIDE